MVKRKKKLLTKKKTSLKENVRSTKRSKTNKKAAHVIPREIIIPPPKTSKNTDLSETRKRTRRTKEELKDMYIDPIEMEALIVEYYDTDIISEKLASMVQMISTRLALARNFYNYSFKSEMQGDAIVKMVTALRRKRFKVGVGYNPFSYFTKVAYHAFQNSIKKHKKDFDTLKRYQEEMYESYACDNNIAAHKNSHHKELDLYAD